MGAAIKIWLLVMGGLCLGLALWLLVRRLRVLLDGVTAPGRVTGHETREDDGDRFYLPIVVFKDGAGREHRFTSVAGGSARTPAAGKDVRVRYLPSDPRLAYLDSLLHMWAAPLALGVLGTAGIAGALMR